MGKRRSDVGQMSKEEYDAMQSREDANEDSGVTAGNHRASQQVLSGRRIVRVNRSKWKKTEGGMRTPSAKLSMPATPASTNVFANTTLPTPTTTTTTAPTPLNTSPKSNPFASVSFATTPANKGTTIGSTRQPFATSTKKQNPSSLASLSFKSSSTPGLAFKTASTSTSTSVSFAATPINKGTTIGSNRQPFATSTKKQTPSSTSFSFGSSQRKNDTNVALNLAMLRMVQKEFNKNPFSDCSKFLKNYLNNFDSDVNENGNIATDTPSTSTSIGSSMDASTSATTSASTTPAIKSTFSFAPATNTDTSNSASSTSGSLFSSKPTENSKPKAFTGFSFAGSTPAPPVPTPAPIPAASTSQTSEEEDKDNEPTQILSEKNEDEDELFQCRAKYLKMVKDEHDKSEWKSFAAGPCQLFRNKNTNKQKIIIRDSMGRLRLNLPVAKGMTFQRKLTKNAGMVSFMSVEKADEGPVLFALKCKKDVFEALCDKLESMAA